MNETLPREYDPSLEGAGPCFLPGASIEMPRVALPSILGRPWGELRTHLVILAAGIPGTILAGATFPTALILLNYLGRGSPVRSLSDMAMFAGVGAVYGACLAGVGAILIFAACGLLLAIGGVFGLSVALAAEAGGWTGFLTSYSISGASGTGIFGASRAVIVATIMGHFGAAWFAALARRSLGAKGRPVGAKQLPRLSLMQMLRLMTAMAIALGAVAFSRPGQSFVAAAAIALLVQAACHGIWCLGAGLRRKTHRNAA